jgi:hypothetical protein
MLTMSRIIRVPLGGHSQGSLALLAWLDESRLLGWNSSRLAPLFTGATHVVPALTPARILVPCQASCITITLTAKVRGHLLGAAIEACRLSKSFDIVKLKPTGVFPSHKSDNMNEKPAGSTRKNRTPPPENPFCPSHPIGVYHERQITPAQGDPDAIWCQNPV